MFVSLCLRFVFMSKPAAPSVTRQRQAVESLKEGGPLVEGETHYVIPAKWWEAFTAYIGIEAAHDAGDEEEEKASERGAEPPGLINCEPLVLAMRGDIAELKPNLMEGSDHDFVGPQTFKLIKAWYGCSHALSRKVIAVGATRMKTIELYPLILHLYRAVPGRPLEPNPEVCTIALCSLHSPLPWLALMPLACSLQTNQTISQTHLLFKSVCNPSLSGMADDVSLLHSCRTAGKVRFAAPSQAGIRQGETHQSQASRSTVVGLRLTPSSVPALNTTHAH